VAANVEVTLRKSFPALKQQISFTPHIRYGFNNTHLNAWGTMVFSRRIFNRDADGMGGTSSRSSWTFAGGKRINQFNKENPITPLFNSVYTLFFKRNYMKLYENYFGNIAWNKRFDNDLRITADLLYEDRLPLENTTDYSFFYKDSRAFTPNYPFEKLATQFDRHHGRRF